eukprot:UC4_evm1s110
MSPVKVDGHTIDFKATEFTLMEPFWAATEVSNNSGESYSNPLLGQLSDSLLDDFVLDSDFMKNGEMPLGTFQSPPKGGVSSLFSYLPDEVAAEIDGIDAFPITGEQDFVVVEGDQITPAILSPPSQGLRLDAESVPSIVRSPPNILAMPAVL